MSATIADPLPALTTDDTTIPRIFAQPTKDGSQLTFWCSHCGSYHLHGRPTGDMIRSRRPHCFIAGSPYEETGYLLVEVSTNDPRLKRAPRGRRPSRRQARP